MHLSISSTLVLSIAEIPYVSKKMKSSKKDPLMRKSKILAFKLTFFCGKAKGVFAEN